MRRIGEALDFLILDRDTSKVKAHTRLAAIDEHIMQMGEWVRFPNGDIANYIDAHKRQDITQSYWLASCSLQ